jgi:DNA-repair protein XRCC1
VNLTSPEHRSWKCKNAGEKQACVVLQLEKEAILTSLDIGNENSAFIEVLVGRSSSPEVDFEVYNFTIIMLQYHE